MQWANMLAEEWQLSNADSSLHYARLALEIAEQLHHKKAIGNAHMQLATAYDLAGNYSLALKNALEARKIFESEQLREELAGCYYRLGKIAYHRSETNEGGDPTSLYKEALNYYESALTLEKTLQHQEGIVNNYIEIGRTRFSLGEQDAALEILREALKISEQFRADKKYIHNVAKSAYNIALIYIEQDSLLNAIHYLSKAVTADSLLENKEGLAGIRMAEMYMRSGNNVTAAVMARQQYDTALAYGYKLRQKQASEVLYQSLANLGKYDEAFRFLQINKAVSDSLRNEDHVREITRLQMNYEFEKIEQQKTEEYQREMTKRNKIIYLGIALLIIILVILIFIYKNYREKQKNNQRLQVAYDIIEEKNEDIMSSIRYAKRIQEAILPPGDVIQQIIPESFILYKPKEVVSGDFYWMEKMDDYCVFAIVDCTGHGVPGAFMSIIGHNSLQRAIHEHKLSTAGEILDKMNELVEETLRQKGATEIRDGMDVALCVVKQVNGKRILEYSGANNALYLIQNNQLTEYRSDKQHIGASEHKSPFRTHKIELSGTENIYLFTDGFADQFGGPKGKKFMYKAFKNLLLAIHHLPLSDQKKQLNEAIENWRGSYEQNDDICVMGVRIS